MYTLKYLVRRVSTYAATLLTAIAINFFIPRLIPGNPIQARLEMLYRQGVWLGGEEFVEKYSKLFLLDQPMHIQFINYLNNLLHGNLGISISNFPSRVEDLIGMRLPWSIGLLAITVMISFGCGLMLGAYICWAGREGKATNLTRPLFMSFMLVSQIPFYLLGMMLIYLLAYSIPLFPIGGGMDLALTPGTVDYLISIMRHATLPAVSIILVQLGGWAVEARSLMVNVLGEDYLLLAKAKGLKEKYIFTRYALRNTTLPTITDLMLSLGGIASGSLMTEIVFSYPGIGSLLYSSINSLDYPVVQGISLLVIFGVTTAALLIDLIYPLLDPRIGEK